jgi:Protein of unknown function (DUF4232)
MRSFTGNNARWPVGVAGVAMAAMLAGCHSVASPPATALATTPAPDATATTAPAAPAPSSTATIRPTLRPVGSARPAPLPVPAGPVRCHTADLGVSFGQSDAGQGHMGVNLILTNRSTHRCRLYGYGGVQLLDEGGNWLPTEQVRISEPAPQLMLLKSGAHAYSALNWIFSPEGPPCEQSAFLLVTPPDETEPIKTAFAERVCAGGQIGQRSYQPAPL